KDLKIFIIISAGLLFLLALIFSVFKESFINLFSEFAKGDKENAVYTNYEFLLKDVWILFFLYLIFLTIIYLINFKKLSETLLLLFLPFFIFDVWRIEKDFIKSIEPPEIYYGEDEVIKFLKNDNDMYRVFPLRYKRADEGLLMLYGIESIGGYVANPLQRYQDFIGAEKSVMFVPINLINYKHLLNLLNVKYIIDIPLPPDIERYPENIKRQLIFWYEFYKDYEKVYSGKDYVIYKNPRDKGRIFFYGKWKILPQDEILKNLFLDKELSYIYIEEDKIKNIDFPPQKDSIEFSYKIKKYEADRIEFEYSLSHPAVCVLSINWHPKWRIRVDGKIVKSFPVNHTLTGFILPEGNHNVKLKFTSKGHKIGILLSFTGYLIFIISLITLIFIGKFKKKE
ncbi:MAG: YfhO family protein, partial [candidate division WOR-3 bacterium]